MGVDRGEDQRPTWASAPRGAEKLAATERFALIATAQVPLPLQSPLQPVKVWPAAEPAGGVTRVAPW